MGCFNTRIDGMQIPSAKNILFLRREPRRSQRWQEVGINIQERITKSMLEESSFLDSEIIVQNNTVIILLSEIQSEINEFSLTQKLKKLIKRANSARKEYILFKKPTFAVENPLLMVKVYPQIFKAIVAALIQFSIEVDLQSLKYVYFLWDEGQIEELFNKYMQYFKSMIML